MSQIRKKTNRTLINYNCFYCGINFLARNLSKRKAKAFCSSKCSTSSSKNYIKDQDRICNPKTGKFEFFKKECNSCLHEYVAKSSKQNCCSLKCSNEYKQKNNLENWLNGEVITKEKIPTFIRRYLFNISDNKCQICNWKEINITTGKIPLTVNHINGNGLDHSRKNLELICPNCHSLTETYCSLNRGNKTRKGY